MSLDFVLFISCGVAEAAVIGLLVARRVWRAFPFFFAYSIWTLVGSVGGYAIHQVAPSYFVRAYLIQIVVDSTLMFAVLVELGWSILRPVRSSLNRGAIIVVIGLILAIGAVIWPFAAVPGSPANRPELYLLNHLQQTFSIMYVVVFLALAGFSQVLSIGWRDRELQIATGLGVYSLVGLAVAMLHAHQTAQAQYSHLNRIVVAGSLFALVYWLVSFAQKEAKRQEFTPQMRDFLLAAAGAARATRVGLTESRSSSLRKPGPH